MNLRFVEAYYWVVTLKSVTRAAEKLHLTQSAMSSRISALEQELGTLLLDRRDRQFRVTIAGQRFFGHACQYRFKLLLHCFARFPEPRRPSPGSPPVKTACG